MKIMETIKYELQDKVYIKTLFDDSSLTQDKISFDFLCLLHEYKSPLEVISIDESVEDKSLLLNCDITGCHFWCNPDNVSIIKEII